MPGVDGGEQGFPVCGLGLPAASGCSLERDERVRHRWAGFELRGRGVLLEHGPPNTVAPIRPSRGIVARSPTVATLRGDAVSWLRVDDSECLDPDVGELSPVEYQARHALLQYCARKHRDDGVFRDREAIHAVYATPKGARSVTRPQLARLIALNLVRRLESYTDDELTALGIERPDGTGWLRPRNWERFNPPRDNTAAERQRRYYSRRSSRRENTVSDDVSNGDETVPRAQARAPVPVPSRNTEPQAVALDADAEPDETNGPRPDHEDPDEQERLATLIANTTTSLRSL